MNKLKDYLIPTIAIVLISVLFVQENTFGQGVINNPQFIVASSSVISVTTTSKQIAATSSRRTALTVQPVNCTTGGGFYLNANNDVAASSATGPFVYASTTFAFGSYPSETPVPTGGIRAIAASGTCSAVITEWRTQ